VAEARLLTKGTSIRW